VVRVLMLVVRVLIIRGKGTDARGKGTDNSWSGTGARLTCSKWTRSPRFAIPRRPTFTFTTTCCRWAMATASTKPGRLQRKSPQMGTPPELEYSTVTVSGHAD
jgi:hypothetical protein